jgi:hypothetical protein
MKGQMAMSEIPAITSSAPAINQFRNQEQIGLMLLRENARAQQAVADLLTQNAYQIKVLAQNIPAGNIDLFV